MLAARGLRDADLCVVLTDDDEVRELNRRWRGLRRTTDVLSFPQAVPPWSFRISRCARNARGQGPGASLLGDVVVSVETAARRRRGSIEREITGLVAHGFLHLLGYDHHRPRDRRAMRAAERRMLRQKAPP